MSVTWEIQESILTITVEGEGGEEPPRALFEAMRDPQFRPGMSLLFDMRLSTDNPTSEEVRARVGRIAPLQASGVVSRCAIVVGPKAHQFGLARMASIYADVEGRQLEIFTRIDEAMNWLSKAGTPEPQTE